MFYIRCHRAKGAKRPIAAALRVARLGVLAACCTTAIAQVEEPRRERGDDKAVLDAAPAPMQESDNSSLLEHNGLLEALPGWQPQMPAKRALVPIPSQSRGLASGFGRWLPATVTDTKSFSEPHAALASDMAVDAGNIVHLAWSHGKQVHYSNNRTATRTVNGFAPPHEIHVATHGEIDALAIAADASGRRVTVTWREGQHIKRIDLLPSTPATGWSGAATAFKAGEWVGPPDVTVSPAGTVHIAFAADGAVYRSSQGGKAKAVASLAGTTIPDVLVRGKGHLAWLDGQRLHYVEQGSATPIEVPVEATLGVLQQHDFAVNTSTGTSHFAVVIARPSGGYQVGYRKGLKGTYMSVADLGEMPATTSIALETDPNGNTWRPHILWSTAKGTGHAVTQNGQWEVAQALEGLSGMGTLRAIAQVRQTTHVFDGLRHSQTYEPYLGAQDPNAELSVLGHTTVNVSTGNAHHLQPVYWSDGAGIATNLSAHYNAQYARPGLLSGGWSLLPFVTHHGSRGEMQVASVRYADGHTTTFLEAGDGRFVAEAEFGDFSILEPVAVDVSSGRVQSRVEPADANGWQLTLTDGERWLFDAAGRLAWRFTPNSKYNSSHIVWTSIAGSTLTNQTVGSDERLPTKVIDSMGRETLLSFLPGSNRLGKIRGPGGALTELHYAAKDGSLSTIRLLARTVNKQQIWTTWRYEYARGALARITPARGDFSDPSSKFDLVYTFDGRVVRIRQPRATHANEVGDFKSSKFRAGWVISYSDARRTAVADPRGYVTDYEHEPARALVRSVAGPNVSHNQRPLEFDYDKHRNLTRASLRDGQVVTFKYDSAGTSRWQHVKNNLAKMTLPGGAQYRWQFYNEFNQPTRHEDPLGQLWYYNYDAAGNLTAVMNPRVRVVPPEGSAVTYKATGLGGSDTGATVAAQLAHTFERWAYLPDGSGRLHEFTDPVGNVRRYTYVTASGDTETGLATGIELRNPAGLTVLSERSIRYNARGHIKQMHAPGDAKHETYERDHLGRATTIAQASRKTRLTYDAASNLVQVVLPSGTVYTHDHDPLNRLAAIVDHNGSWKARGFKSQPRRTFHHTARGELRRSTDFNSHATDLETNGLGWLVRRTLRKKSGDRVTEFGYGPHGNILTQVEHGKPKDRITQYRYDVRGNLTKVIYPDGLTEQFLRYDVLDRMRAWGMVRGLLLLSGQQVQYDALDRVASVLRIEANPGTSVTTLDYNRAEGMRTQYFYDANGSLRAQADALGHVWQTTYNAASLPVDRYDARGYVTQRRVYTKGGRPLVDLVPDPVRSVNPASVWRPPNTPYPGAKYFTLARAYLVRNDWGEPTALMDGAGRTTTLAYDAMGRVKASTDPAGGRTTYERDHRGLITRRQQHVNRTQQPAIALGTIVTEWQYGPNGNLARVVLPHESGKKAGRDFDQFEYDEEDLPVRHDVMKYKAVPKPDDVPLYRHRWAYDQFGALASYTSPRGYRTRYDYDVNGNNVRQRTDLLRERYQSSGALADMRLAVADLQIGFHHGLVPKLWKETAVQSDFVLNSSDEPVAEAPLKGRYIKMEHRLDGFLRPRSVLYFNDSASPIKSRTDRVSLDYDEAGRLRQMTDLEGNVTAYLRDAQANPWKLRYTPFGQAREDWATFEHDAMGRRTRSHYIDGSIEKRSYTRRGFTRRIHLQDKRLPAKTLVDLRYRYDAHGNPAQLDVGHLFHKGAAGQKARRPLRIQYQHTPVTHWLRREELRAVDSAAGEQLSRMSYTYDARGNRVHAQGARGAGKIDIAYEYGSANRLEKVTWQGSLAAEAFYDEASSVNLKQLVAMSRDFYKGGSLVYGYDGGGNLVGRHRRLVTKLRWAIADKQHSFHSPGYIAQVDTTEDMFQYDFNDRLQSHERRRDIHFGEYIWMPKRAVQQREYPGSRFAARKFTYTYLPTETPARFIKRDISDNKTFVNVHAPGSVIGDYELSGKSLKHLASAIVADGLDELIARVPAKAGGGSPDIFHHDALGSVVAVTARNGSVKSRQLYDAWGNKLDIAAPGALPEGRYGFTGREVDRESELMNFRSRMYDPWAGRFVQRDGDDPTLQHYLYADNRPGVFVDPLGTKKHYKRRAQQRATAKRGRRKAHSRLARKAARKAAHAMERSVRRGGWQNRRFFRQLDAAARTALDTIDRIKSWQGIAEHPIQSVASKLRGKAVRGVVDKAARAGMTLARGAKGVSLPGLVSEVVTLECDTPQAFEGKYFCDVPPDWTRPFVREGYRPERVMKPASWDPFGIVTEASEEWRIVKPPTSESGLRDFLYEVNQLVTVQGSPEPVQPVIRNPCYRYVDAGIPDPAQADSSDCYEPNPSPQKMYLPKRGGGGPGAANWGAPAGGGGSDNYVKFPSAKKLPPPTPKPKKAAAPGGGVVGSPGSSGGSNWGFCSSWQFPVPYPCKLSSGSGSGGSGGWDYEQKDWIDY